MTFDDLEASESVSCLYCLNGHSRFITCSAKTQIMLSEMKRRTVLEIFMFEELANRFKFPKDCKHIQHVDEIKILAVQVNHNFAKLVCCMFISFTI